MRRRAAHLIFMNADLCSVETFSIKWVGILHFFDCLNFNDHIIHWERLGKSDSFMGQVMFVFSSLFIPADLAHT